VPTKRSDLPVIKEGGVMVTKALTQKARRREAFVEGVKAEVANSQFGNTKANNTRARVMNSMSRYKMIHKDNLYAIVMPAGHGKTQMAEKFGFIDVDLMVGEDTHDKLVDIREKALRSGNWSDHNALWYSRLRLSVNMLDLSRPVVILLQHEECALEIGAQPLGTFILDESTFSHNISRRDKIGREFSIANYHSAKNSVVNPVTYCFGNVELRQRVFDILHKYNIPTPAPWMGSVPFDSPYYHSAVPEHIKEGRACVDANEFYRLVETGWVPKECLDYQAKIVTGLKSAYGYGYTMNDWATLVGEASDHINKRVMVDLSGDLLELYPPRIMKELHRANVTLRRLDKVFRITKEPVSVSILSRHVGEPHIFVTSLLSHFNWNIREGRLRDMMLKWYFVSYKAWPKVMKDLHGMVRTSSYFMNTKLKEEERQSLMYMDLLVGREDYEIDIRDAVDVRLGNSFFSDHQAIDDKTGFWSSEEYDNVFDLALKQSFSRIQEKPRPVNIKSFWDFYMRRKSWLTAGSLVYNKINKEKLDYTSEILDTTGRVVERLQRRHTKASFFEVNEIIDAIGELGEDELNNTKLMKKYETGGKHRILLPGSLVHYLIVSYVLFFFEKQEQVGSVRVNAPYDEHIAYTDTKMTNGLHHLLYDWKDFNEDHSVADMAKVTAYIFAVMETPKDMRPFVEAIINSLHQMTIIDKEGNLHKLFKGLFSGWRDTSNTNSILNNVYVEIGRICYKRIYQEDPIVYKDHGGDDLDAAFRDAKSAVRFFYVMERIGFPANIVKQMVDTKSEFFRVTITNEGVYASPTRALASFIAGDWENSRPIPVKERIAGLMDQIAQLERRGMSKEFSRGATIMVVAHWCRIKSGESWVDLPPEVIHGELADGGLGIPDGDGEIWKLSKPVPKLATIEGSKKPVGNKASLDYIAVMSKRLRSMGLALIDQELAVTRLAVSVFDYGILPETETLRPLLDYDGKCVSTRPAVEAKWDEAIFYAFLNCDDKLLDQNKYSTVAMFADNLDNIESVSGKMSRRELISILSGGQVVEEALDFQGDIAYRRICPAYLANRATRLCRELINSGRYTREEGEEAFKIICYMCSQVYNTWV